MPAKKTNLSQYTRNAKRWKRIRAQEREEDRFRENLAGRRTYLGYFFSPDSPRRTMFLTLDEVARNSYLQRRYLDSISIIKGEPQEITKIDLPEHRDVSMKVQIKEERKDETENEDESYESYDIKDIFIKEEEEFIKPVYTEPPNNLATKPIVEPEPQLYPLLKIYENKIKRKARVYTAKKRNLRSSRFD